MARRYTRRTALGLAAGALTACTGTAAERPDRTGTPPAPSLTGAPRTTTTVVPVKWTAQNLGLNYAWLNDHRGNQRVNWLADGYDPAAVEADLDVIVDIGVRVVRAFCAVESVLSFDGTGFVAEPIALANLHHFLAAVTARGIALIPVMADGNASGPPQSLDGKFRWPLAATEEGRSVYAEALRRYVGEVAPRAEIACWQTFNEPYATVVGSARLRASGVDADIAHRYLCSAYEVVKGLGVPAPVAFSDLHEEQQEKYRLFSDPTRRARYVDDCTDVYALHLFRSRVDELPDLRSAGSRPRWCVELGNSNYHDPTGETHGGRPAALELYDEHENADAVQTLGAALVESGFSLVMPWSMADNAGMFTHNLDGSHTLKRLPKWMRTQLRSTQSSNDS